MYTKFIWVPGKSFLKGFSLLCSINLVMWSCCSFCEWYMEILGEITISIWLFRFQCVIFFYFQVRFICFSLNSNTITCCRDKDAYVNTNKLLNCLNGPREDAFITSFMSSRNSNLHLSKVTRDNVVNTNSLSQRHDSNKMLAASVKESPGVVHHEQRQFLNTTLNRPGKPKQNVIRASVQCVAITCDNGSVHVQH